MIVGKSIIKFISISIITGLMISALGCSSGTSGSAFVLGQNGTTTGASTLLPSAPIVTVPSNPTTPTGPASATYEATIAGDAPAYYWRLDGTSGTTFNDTVGGNTANVLGSSANFTFGVMGALTGDADTALGFTGGSYLYTSSFIPGPNTFSVEFWMQTSFAGGRVVGFGNFQTGTSTAYDRHIYMDSSGHLIFGVDPTGGVAGINTISSPGTYADGQWHHVVGTCCGGSGGFILYVDGETVATGNASSGQSYSGYWRMGYDGLNLWPGAASYSYFGNLDEVAIYNTILTPTQITNHYNVAK